MAKSKYIDRDNLYSDRMDADSGGEDFMGGLPAEISGGIAGLPAGAAPAEVASAIGAGLASLPAQAAPAAKDLGKPIYAVDRQGNNRIIGYEQDPEAVKAGKIDVPKPPEILAKEKELGHELEPIYAEGEVKHGSGTSSTKEFGEPIGYRYDNGKSEYVNFDTSGQQTGIRERSNLGTLVRDLAPLALTAVGANFLAPMLTGGAGAAGAAATPLTFTPEMIAAGMTPGGIGAAGAAANVLNAGQLAAMYGVNSGIATLAPTLSQLPSGPPGTPGTPPPPGLEPPLPSGIETLPSGPPSTPGAPPPTPLESPLPVEPPMPSGPPSTPGTPPPPGLEEPIPSGPPSTPGTPPPPNVGPPGSNIPPPTPTLPPTATPGTPPPPNVGPPGSNIPTPTPGITDLLKKAKDVLIGSDSGSGLGGTLGLLALMAMMNKGNNTPQAASTATIPSLTANRTQLPYDVNKAGVNPNTPYRPGQGGVNYFSPTTYTPKAAGGGLMSLGGYSDGGRLLQGPGDGVSDSIPAIIGHKQPARLANGEFVIPARIVSELGNGSTDAGAKRLYEMMDRVQRVRRKTKNVAANTKAAKYLPA